MRLLDLPQYSWKIIDGCDWESVENREAVKHVHQLGLLFRGCCVEHDDAVVSKKATSLVLVVDVRIAVMLPVSQVHSSKAQIRRKSSGPSLSDAGTDENDL